MRDEWAWCFFCLFCRIIRFYYATSSISPKAQLIITQHGCWHSVLFSTFVRWGNTKAKWSKSVQVKTDSVTRVIGEIKRKKQALTNNIQTRFHGSEAECFSGQSKFTSFLSPFQPFEVKAVWPTYDEVDQKYVWEFAGGSLSFQVPAAKMIEKILKCQCGIRLEG